MFMIGYSELISKMHLVGLLLLSSFFAGCHYDSRDYGDDNFMEMSNNNSHLSIRMVIEESEMHIDYHLFLRRVENFGDTITFYKQAAGDSSATNERKLFSKIECDSLFLLIGNIYNQFKPDLIPKETFSQSHFLIEIASNTNSITMAYYKFSDLFSINPEVTMFLNFINRKFENKIEKRV